MIREWMFARRHRRACAATLASEAEKRRLEACAELQRDVERRRQSYEVQRYRDKRAAALKASRA